MQRPAWKKHPMRVETEWKSGKISSVNPDFYETEAPPFHWLGTFYQRW